VDGVLYLGVHGANYWDARFGLQTDDWQMSTNQDIAKRSWRITATNDHGNLVLDVVKSDMTRDEVDIWCYNHPEYCFWETFNIQRIKGT
jgi:hypothetical protein